jgi:hypothetical protein
MDEITSASMQRLLGVSKVALNDLAKRGVVVRGKKRGSYTVESIASYCAHHREQAAGRGGEDAVAAARARLGSAQARQKRRRNSLPVNLSRSRRSRPSGGQSSCRAHPRQRPVGATERDANERALRVSNGACED